MNKIKIYHFHNGTGGGVFSVIKNLLRFSVDKNIENHIIHAINTQIVPDYVIEPVTGAASQLLYYYTRQNNFYHTCRQLANLLPDDKAIIVAHDWLELGMASNLGLQNPVVQMVHGNYDYYYEIAKKNSVAIDAYICISKKIEQSLNYYLPQRQKDIMQLYYPVPDVNIKTKTSNTLNIIFYAGSLKDNNKQFFTVREIAKQLADFGKNYFFTIAGGDMTEAEFDALWPIEMKHYVRFKGLLSNENILKLLQKQDIFLLPSLGEGLPVSVVEAMKAGVVPLVTDWNAGEDELIIPGFTGYYFKVGAIAEYVSCINSLYNNRKLLKEISRNCINKANRLFDPFQNTEKIEELFRKVNGQKRKNKLALKVYGSRLDIRWLPNRLVKIFRNSI